MKNVILFLTFLSLSASALTFVDVQKSDIKTQIEFFNVTKKTASEGDVKAQFDLGCCYSTGVGVEKNQQEAFKWWKKAAEQDRECAQKLGALYFFGLFNVKKDIREVVKWWKKAAEQGDVNAQCGLGFCYEKGIYGLEKNQQEAVKWYRKAAEQGDSSAQFNLGRYYSLGYGTEKNQQEAVKWYRKAAEQGHSSAQLALGLSYYSGRGVIQNKIKAYAWFVLSYKNGLEKANDMMKVLPEEMSPRQIEEACKLAEKYDKGIFDDVSTPKKENNIKTGSGFSITSNGYIITNYHVIADSSDITVVKDGMEYPAITIISDVSNDIAVLKITQKTKPLPIITSRKAKIGSNVYSMGFPNVHLQGLSPKFTSGEISSLTGLRDDPKYFQISVPIQPGNSGGALVDGRGNVIGIVTAKLNQTAAIIATGTIAENVNYALKSSYILILLESNPSISDNLTDENRQDITSESIAERLKESTYFIIAK